MQTNILHAAQISVWTSCCGGKPCIVAHQRWLNFVPQLLLQLVLLAPAFAVVAAAAVSWTHLVFVADVLQGDERLLPFPQLQLLLYVISAARQLQQRWLHLV